MRGKLLILRCLMTKRMLTWIIVIGMTVFINDRLGGSPPFGPCRVIMRIHTRDASNEQQRPFIVSRGTACRLCTGSHSAYWGLPVVTAARFGDFNALKSILEDGADPNEEYGDKTALMGLSRCRRESDSERCAPLLVEHGAVIDKTNNYGRSALHYAAGSGLPKLVMWFIDHGAELNRRDNRGNTPLHLVARDAFSMSGFRSENDIEEVITSLIEAGADTLIENEDGKTAVEICRGGPYKRDAFDAAIRSGGNGEK